MVRANVKSMAGNALLNYQLNKCVLIDHPYKNQVCMENRSHHISSGTSLIRTPLGQTKVSLIERCP